MCRPIESRDSLGAMGPAAVALFAGYQPTASKAMMSQNAKIGQAPAWSTAEGLPFTADGMNMLSMAAPPPALPFVSFPKATNMPTMPWTAAPNTDLMGLSMSTEQFVTAPLESEVKPESNAITQPDFETQELEELLDFSMPSELENLDKDKPNLVNLDDGFDGTEMSILYSFLVDAPEDKKKAVEVDDGILNLNVLAGTPIEGLMDSLEGLTDTELMMTPRLPETHIETKVKAGEMKSRRLCKSEGCYKRSRSNGLCISHGGGRRCAVEGCDKSSQGGNLCIRHGGGKRCSHEGCDKAAQSNFLCKAHGGGPRCQFNGCSRSSQGGGFCRSHGGGKRCMFDGCDKGTQRGDYCALHGGSRLCEVPGCMRNDRGGGLCATHGGGKRCTMEACSKPCRRKGLCSAHLRQAEATNWSRLKAWV
ncbi:hypothetical protein BBO99_00001661 [Phytophthora kernoviae]|uniref:WRKY19-like zinc finger domain-containing protein n=2 Tax=Phytophthora kernoviae TaxID=325452 RepID=A0A3R7JAW4_9STRA|nr:hypothetical protein G195_009054 [Phytophthora kernoviae 00238/432]KAG2512331.1 hypothetical protein JM16_008127 [Phytophthora kernoviae]KAG2519676.1 hypothetical protein JM18_007385 [Phytophthora kernoviae]RLN31828.1 hypothetical protein BBI17_000488 [Phytophthora kernoviae]RLN83930.1 hypothetical protein BBO99_00001661 [Phytophthora kernoviae]